MKSRWTTYLLAVVVVIVWGLIAKRILFDKPAQPAAVVVKNDKTDTALSSYETDTLRCDYPDPFRIERKPPPKRKSKMPVKMTRPVKTGRRKVPMRYYGSVRSGKTLLHIVDIGDVRYELFMGECADGYRLKSADADSLYFERENIIYSLSRNI